MPSILIVDDEEGLLNSLAAAFRFQGYRVEAAETAQAALEVLGREPFDVLLTDVVMPGMDGLALMERSQSRFPRMPVVLMTGGTTVETAVQALKGGAADYVLKPFTLTEIFHVVEQALEQDRLRRENLELSELNRRLGELDQVKSNLLSAMTHEFRTPLTVIQGWLDHLMGAEAEALTQGQRESLTAIRQSVLRLSRLIANLLALVESHAGQGTEGAGPVSLWELLRSAAELVSAEAAKRGVAVSIGEAEGMYAVVGDGARLGLLFLNLLENAVKFSERGGAVRVAVSKSERELEACITNTSGEIPADQIPRLLQPFTQGDMGLTRAAGGLGLGLAVVRAIVHRHGGALFVETGKGRGTTVRVRLPRAPREG
ncbi:MAG: response regulator [candidate division NC10 bacterium]|nr:response regulator [candidate division NC10 bacterium]